MEKKINKIRQCTITDLGALDVQINTPEVQQAMMLRLTYKLHPVSSLFHGEYYEVDFITLEVLKHVCPSVVNTLFPRHFTVPSFITQFTCAVGMIILFMLQVLSV